MVGLVMQAGVDMVADLVGVTLGPKGRNVVLQNKYGPPKIVNDGETVLKEVLHTYPFVHYPLLVLFYLVHFIQTCLQILI
jgi:hypothetical protein